MSDNLVTATQSPSEAPLQPATAAMTVLAEAEVIAGSIRAEADHYARQREAEADLLIQKARRVLEAAEAKASMIIAGARAEVASHVDQTIDLDAIEPEIEQRDPSELDRLLDDAIGRAVSDALAED